jgi:hypothetical protein
MRRALRELWRLLARRRTSASGVAFAGLRD